MTLWKNRQLQLKTKEVQRKEGIFLDLLTKQCQVLHRNPGLLTPELRMALSTEEPCLHLIIGKDAFSPQAARRVRARLVSHTLPSFLTLDVQG